MSPLPIEQLRRAEREAKKAWEEAVSAVRQANERVINSHGVWLAASRALLEAERHAKANKSTK